MGTFLANFEKISLEECQKMLLDKTLTNRSNGRGNLQRCQKEALDLYRSLMKTSDPYSNNSPDVKRLIDEIYDRVSRYLESQKEVFCEFVKRIKDVGTSKYYPLSPDMYDIPTVRSIIMRIFGDDKSYNTQRQRLLDIIKTYGDCFVVSDQTDQTKIQVGRELYRISKGIRPTITKVELIEYIGRLFSISCQDQKSKGDWMEYYKGIDGTDALRIYGKLLDSGSSDIPNKDRKIFANDGCKEVMRDCAKSIDVLLQNFQNNGMINDIFKDIERWKKEIGDKCTDEKEKLARSRKEIQEKSKGVAQPGVPIEPNSKRAMDVFFAVVKHGASDTLFYGVFGEGEGMPDELVRRIFYKFPRGQNGEIDENGTPGGITPKNGRDCTLQNYWTPFTIHQGMSHVMVMGLPKI